MKLSERIREFNQREAEKKALLTKRVVDDSSKEHEESMRKVESDANALMQAMLTGHLADVITSHRPSVKVLNQPKRMEVTGAVFTPELSSLPGGISELHTAIVQMFHHQEATSQKQQELLDVLIGVVGALKDATEGNKEISVSNLQDIAPHTPPEPLKRVSADIKSLPGYVSDDLTKLNQGIQRVAQAAEVTASKSYPQVDTTPVTKELQSLGDSVKRMFGFQTDIKKISDSLESAVEKVEKAVTNKIIPVPNISLPKAEDGSVQVTVVSGGAGGGGSEIIGTNVFAGQATWNSGGAVTIATTSTVKNGVVVSALSTNTSTVFVGQSGVTTSTGFELSPGQSIGFAVNDPSKIFVIGTVSGSKVCWAAAA